MIDAALSRPVPEMSLAEVIRGYYYWKRQARSGAGSAMEIATEFRQELRRRGASDRAQFVARGN